MSRQPHPRDFRSRSAYVEACVPAGAYGYGGYLKMSMAEEDERDAGARWDVWHRHDVKLRERVALMLCKPCWKWIKEQIDRHGRRCVARRRWKRRSAA